MVAPGNNEESSVKVSDNLEQQNIIINLTKETLVDVDKMTRGAEILASIRISLARY